MRNSVLLLILFIFVGCTHSTDKNVADKDVKEIFIDPETFEKYLDLSGILNDSIEIVPLETTEECLISEINQIELYKDKIYMSDCTNSYYRERIDSIVGKISDDSNPILIKCRFRGK